MAECISASPKGEHTVQLRVPVLRELNQRLQLIFKFRRNILTKSKLEIEDLIRSTPQYVGKSTPRGWSSQNDVELLLGMLCPFDVCLRTVFLIFDHLFLLSLYYDI